MMFLLHWYIQQIEVLLEVFSDQVYSMFSYVQVRHRTSRHEQEEFLPLLPDDWESSYNVHRVYAILNLSKLLVFDRVVHNDY